VSTPRVELLKALAHPLRLGVVDRLGHLGPATVSALATELDVPLPELSNHLKRLRDAGLVSARREGRHAVYELSESVEVLLPLLDRLTRPADRPVGRAPSRTCYDHLAGPLGVGLYRGLLERGALSARPDGTVKLRDHALLAGLGVGAVEPGRRRLAFECLDATEHAPHLAGALGDALAGALLERGWVRHGDGREIELTRRGAAGLRRTLGVELSTPARTGAPAGPPATPRG
jgi:DNA-binding transcriptional ArsR family regulator